MRVMYDSINASAIPADAQMVAGYVDGAFMWSAADWARFPNAVHVGIAVFASTNAGQVLDVESGNATPQEAPAWCRMRQAAGQIPTVYCSDSTWPAVTAAFSAAGMPAPQWWQALYDYVAQLPPGCVAKQYTDNPPSNPYDTSVVADQWPGVGSGQQTGGSEVFWVKNPSSNECILFSGGFGLGIAAYADLIACQKAGIPELPGISQQFFDSIPMATAIPTPTALGSLTLTGTMKDNGNGTFTFTGTGTPG